MRALVLIPALALAACGQPEPIRILPPAELATCADAPAVPTNLPPQGTTERDEATLAVWLAERAAGADCRAKVRGLSTWMKEPT